MPLLTQSFMLILYYHLLAWSGCIRPCSSLVPGHPPEVTCKRIVSKLVSYLDFAELFDNPGLSLSLSVVTSFVECDMI